MSRKTSRKQKEIVYTDNKNQPTLEIFEIEMKNSGRRKEEQKFFDDSSLDYKVRMMIKKYEIMTVFQTNFDDFDSEISEYDLQSNSKNYFKKTFSIGGCSTIFNLGIPIILPIICLFETI